MQAHVDRPLAVLDNMTTVRRYFQEVERLDEAAMSRADIDPKAILKLWTADGEMVLAGPEPLGQRRMLGRKELEAFYRGRGHGVADVLSRLAKAVTQSISEPGDQVVVKGTRYAVSTRGEGVEAPFTHSFQLTPQGKISRLRIEVGGPRASDHAPQGALRIEDMGRLTAVAWAVA